MGRFRTDFLFAPPSFLSGASRVLDLFGLFDSYNESKDGKEADAKAIYADWAMVGQDIWNAGRQSDVETKEYQLQLDFSK
jgi:hypothetical protein